MRAGGITVEIERLPSVLSKLRRDDLFAASWRRALERATVLVKERVPEVAPRDSGRLAASRAHRLDARPVPRYGVVSVQAVRGKARYPFVLQAGHRRPKGMTRRQARVAPAGSLIELHYRRGRLAGQSTRGWLNRAARSVQSRVNSILANAAREIERRWQSP